MHFLLYTRDRDEEPVAELLTWCESCYEYAPTTGFTFRAVSYHLDMLMFRLVLFPWFGANQVHASMCGDDSSHDEIASIEEVSQRLWADPAKRSRIPDAVSALKCHLILDSTTWAHPRPLSGKGREENS